MCESLAASAKNQGRGTATMTERKMIQSSLGKRIQYGCSNCNWYFELSVQVDAPTGQTEEEQRKIHETQRDKSFYVHDCSKYPKPKSK
jgi:hypothetical protein